MSYSQKLRLSKKIPELLGLTKEDVSLHVFTMQSSAGVRWRFVGK